MEFEFDFEGSLNISIIHSLELHYPIIK